MLVVYLDTTDPYFNLAAEEYFLKHTQEEYFLLWRNAPCIVVGRNQNTRKEINHEYVTSQGIPVVRRLTGGGTVFHDLGNLNYTFIQKGVEHHFGNYSVFAKPVIDTLAQMGVTATLSGRNDLLIQDKKFCGQAQTMWHGRLMHHGCMLFSANVDHLTKALQVNPLKIQSKGINSVRSRVTNIADHLTKDHTVMEFAALLMNRLLEDPENELYELTAEDMAAIGALQQEKYVTHRWNYGFGKEYSFQKDTRFPSGIVTVSLNIGQDTITEVSLKGDFFGIADVSALEEKLMGVPYEEEKVLAVLQQVNLQQYMAGISPEELLSAMF
ncbi:MAG: lipoate--protein ligase [Clostridia bacterium]|nr:lipoate--protein ligase [Clostridia bacterium]